MVEGTGNLTTRPAHPFAVLHCTAPHAKIDLPFATPGDLADWAEKERAHWSSLAQAATRGDFGNYLRNAKPAALEQERYEQLGKSARAVADKLAKGEAIERQSGCIKLLKDAEELIDKYDLLCSETALGKAVASLSDKQTQLYGALFCGQGNRITELVRTGTLVFEDLLIAFRTRYPIDIKAVDPQSTDLLSRQKWLSDSQNHLENELEQIDKLEQRLKEKLFFHPSRKYWANKARWHWCGAAVAGAIVSITVGKLLSYAISGGFNDMLNVASKNNVNDHWGYLILFTLPTLAIFYALRPVMKFFTFSLQRAGDAGERATMVLTYLALTEQENRRPTEAERLLVLRQLFRPGPGDTPDDSSQDTLLEQLMKPTGNVRP